MLDVDLLSQYASDQSEAEPSMPDAVIRVSKAQDVASILEVANRYEVPVTPRAGGTGRTGGAVPICGGIVVAFERMQSIKGIEVEDALAIVEPGVVTGRLHEAVEKEHLFYPPDPNSLGSCCIGGNIAENAGGPRAFKYGVTREYVLGLEVVTAEGQIIKLGKNTVKGVTGYDLVALMVGSEGTLGIVTEARLKLRALPERVGTLLVLFRDALSMQRSVQVMTHARVVPRCIEFLDRAAIEVVRPHVAVPLSDAVNGLLIVEVDGSERDVEATTENLGQRLREHGALEVFVAKHGSDRERLWSARRELSYAMRRQARHKISEDVVVPRSQLSKLLLDVQTIAERRAIKAATYGHAGDGNLHINFLWNDDEEKPLVDAAIEDLFKSVVALGGTLSGEHGIGLMKQKYLSLEQSDALMQWQRRIKTVCDPKNILNPHKIFPVEKVSSSCVGC